MDWEEIAITELYQRFESIYRSVDKAVFPGLCSSLLQHSSSWSVLSDGIAHLTGATDRFGSPIIYIPHNAKLADTNENDFRGAIKYLVAATNASSVDVGFVVLIDSRQSRWSSLAWVLRNVASCFPGELKMILALRPTNFLHGTLSTIAMRYQKDEYNYKVPIELLACIDNVWPWISKTDLPQQLGGEAQYDHSSWLRRRLTIENLATILKRVIQRCKSYSTTLINEQLLPDDDNEEKISSQNEECRSVMTEVETLQDKGREILQDDIWQVVPCEKEVVSTSFKDVQHLCSLILEVKDTFGNFWKTYEAKRAGYLQLKSFEKNYKRAATRISCLIENLEIRTVGESGDDGISPSSSENGMAEICVRACTDGEALMRDHPYAIDCIKPKCEELKRLSQCFQTLMEEKIQNESLIRSTKVDIHEVNEWSSAGMKLLSVQNLDRAKTCDGLQAALSELDAFTSTSSSLKIPSLRESLSEKIPALDQIEKSIEECLNQFDLVVELFEKRKAILMLHPRHDTTKDVKLPHEKPKKTEALVSKQENTAIVHPIPKFQPTETGATSTSERQHKLRQVINELVETERKYVEELTEIVQGYGHVVDDETMEEFLPASLTKNKHLLLGNLEEILLFHEHNLLPILIECEWDEISIGDLFISKTSEFSLYYEYCHGSDKRKVFRKQIGENHAFFAECQRRLGHRLPLSAYLLKPIQRITKYQLLLQQMEKYSQDSKSDTVAKAVAAMMDVLKELNDSMHQISILGFPDDFGSLGRLLMQQSVQVQTETRKGKVKDFARSKFNKALLRHLFLYENGLLICKKCQNMEEVENNSTNLKSGPKMKNSEVQNSYQFKRYVKAQQFSLTETIKGCPRKFKLQCHDDDTEITITTPTQAVKQSWIKSLQKSVRQSREPVPAQESPSKRLKSDSPCRASPTRKRLESMSKVEKPVEARHSKIQRSKSLGKNSPKPPAKSFLDRQKSFATGDNTISKRVAKRIKVAPNSKGAERRSSAVTFGNIHGVDKSPSKVNVRNASAEEKPKRKPIDVKPQQPFRGKKKTKS